jgi:hypothetical protein
VWRENSISGANSASLMCRQPAGVSPISSTSKEERVIELLAFMESSCYATNTLRQPVEVVPRLLLNGRNVALNLVR